MTSWTTGCNSVSTAVAYTCQCTSNTELVCSERLCFSISGVLASREDVEGVMFTLCRDTFSFVGRRPPRGLSHCRVPKLAATTTLSVDTVVHSRTANDLENIDPINRSICCSEMLCRMRMVQIQPRTHATSCRSNGCRSATWSRSCR